MSRSVPKWWQAATEPPKPLDVEELRGILEAEKARVVKLEPYVHICSYEEWLLWQEYYKGLEEEREQREAGDKASAEDSGGD